MDGLAAVVQQQLRLDPFCSGVFVFRAKRADLMKLLACDGSGQTCISNVSRPVVRMVYRRQVFADAAFLSDDLFADRMRPTRQPGARFASACFVTGALDPFDDRPAFLAAARRVQGPILMLYGRDTPPKSRAEMEALAGLPG